MSSLTIASVQIDNSEYKKVNGVNTFSISGRYFVGNNTLSQLENVFGNEIVTAQNTLMDQEVNLILQFSSIDNVSTNVTQKPISLQLSNKQGIPFSFNVQDNNFNPYDVMRVQIMMISQSGFPLTNQVGIQENLIIENIGTVPNPVQISVGVSNDQAVINWSGQDNILQYHIVVKNENTGQTIKEFNVSGSQTNTTITNLESATNYKIYIIAVNQIGNSPETSKAFTTSGTITPPIEPPIEPPIQLNADNFLPNGNVRVIRVTGIPANDYEVTDGVALENLQSYLDRGVFRLLTQAELDYVAPPVIVPPVVVPPVIVPPVVVPKEYDVNTYRINEFGGVYNEIIYGIDGNRLLQLEAEFLVTLVGSPTPSDQEVKDFYNYIDIDTSVKTTMVEQRFLEFKIVDGYVQGKINHVATQFFTDYWRSKTIYSIIKIDDSNGNPILLGNEPKQSQKVNELRFNQDDFEQITINEYVGDIPALTITAYVWDKINLNSNPQAFSGVKTLEVVKDDPDGKTCPTGYHLGFNGKCVLDGGTETGGATSIIGKALGFTALLGTLALLGAKRR